MAEIFAWKIAQLAIDVPRASPLYVTFETAEISVSS
jgi:hypothetical protein